MPGGAVAQGAGQSGDQLVGQRDAWLQVNRLDLEQALLSVGFRVQPSDEGAAVQNRQGEVAIPAPGGGSVHLDAVLEPEQRLSAAPVAEDGVERREESRPGG